MKIILNQDVPNLGEEGDVRDVAKGYARNYLFPKKMAIKYNNQNLLTIEARRAAIEARKEEKRKEALSLKEKLESEELKFSMSAGESGKLFGSVTPSSVTEELEKLGYKIEKKRIEIADGHIRQLGEHSVNIKLYGDEEATVKIVVARVV